MDVVPPEYLLSPSGALWASYFEKVTAQILPQYIDLHYLDVYQRERAKHANNPNAASFGRTSFDPPSASKTSAQLANAPPPASKNEKIEISKIQTKAIQVGDLVRAPADSPAVQKPEKWSIQKTKVTVYGELKYNGYTNALSPEDFDALVEENTGKASVPVKPKCTCNSSLTSIALDLNAEVSSCKEHIQTVCQTIQTTFDQLTETRKDLATLLHETDK